MIAKQNHYLPQMVGKPDSTNLALVSNAILGQACRRLRGLAVAALLSLISVGVVNAAELVYRLHPVEIAPGCYVVVGSEDHFNTVNGGNIVNIGFVVTDDGVVVVDSGMSRRYGEALRRAIDKVSGGLRIERVIVTHGHPDHYLGNQAFLDVPVYGGPGTVNLINTSGEDFTVNMYRLVGDWMRGTESLPPNREAKPGRFKVGDHRFELFRFGGHTVEDLVLLDESCGALYAGDLVFNTRTLSTPHADIETWLANLEKLKSIPFKILIPGHGEVSEGTAAIEQTIDYLRWIERRLQRAFRAGLDMTEVMELPIPDRFASFSLARDEYRRSVHNLYPAIEASNLPRIDQEN